MKTIGLFVATSIFLLFVSCKKNRTEAVNTPISSIKISTGTIYPAFDLQIKDYYISSLNTLNTFQITLEDFKSSQIVYINGIKVKEKVTNVKLKMEQDIKIEYQVNKDSFEVYTIHYLPKDMPKVNVILKKAPSEGFILANLSQLSLTTLPDYCYITILNNDGFPVYYKRLPYRGVINFRYFDIGNNQKRFTYNIDDLGKVEVMNEKFEVIKQLDLLPNRNHGALRSDNHDVLYFDDNHYVLPNYYTREKVDMSSYNGKSSIDIGEFLFQEIKDNKVIFEWDTRDHPELLDYTDPIYYQQYATGQKVDYFHFNSISTDPNDQNYIISARHTNQIYKVDRKTGGIIWRFGGKNDSFNLTGNKIISHPHHATILSNGNLLLFDNGVTKNPKQSRIAEFSLDEKNFTANLVFEYTESGRYFDIMGSAQKLDNGNYLIGWGGNITSQVNANKSDITEVTANGDIVLDLSFTNNSMFVYSYRALKYKISF